MKHQVLFSPKNSEKIFMNVVCCSRDWRFMGLFLAHLDEVQKELLHYQVLA